MGQSAITTGHGSGSHVDAPGIEPGSARVGPNAVLQLIPAIDARYGRATTADVFALAGHPEALQCPSDAMVDQAIPAAIMTTLWRAMPPRDAAAIARDAGRRTGAYILANRIPGPVCTLLKLSPARWAAPLLVKAITRYAWTFAGSGVCTARFPDGPHLVRLVIRNNPLNLPGCPWHCGVFETLFRSLVSPAAAVRHRDDTDGPDRLCVFDISLKPATAPRHEPLEGPPI